MARRGFTLIELLVAIAIIAILIAIILPGLARARVAAKRTKCGSNLHAIGIACSGYLNDNKGTFPVHGNWGNVVGRLGTKLRYDDAAPGTGFPGDTTTAGVPVPSRPLNRYLDSPLACKCPDDRGDNLIANVPNCYQSYGTSYLVEWQWDTFGVLHITADGSRRPFREDAAAGPLSRKVVMGDWVWHANRALSVWSNQWHNPRGLRQYMMLFADAHAEYFTFPKEIEGSEWAQDGAIKPDPGRGWW